tara:strand:- start:472 stop:1191 length:720 start_codon:yes stop_codon:yes gene_type:complete
MNIFFVYRLLLFIKLFIIFVILSCSFLLAQQTMGNKILDLNNFGSEIGSFINIGSDYLEIDGYVELKTRFGIFSDVWFDQIDLDQDTDIQSYSSIGFMKNFKNNFILGFGYANSRSQSITNLNELFIGSSIKSFTGVTYFDYVNNNISFLGNIDISSYLNFKLLDVTFDGLFYNGSSDLFIRFSKNNNSGVSIGYILSRQRFEGTETKTFSKTSGYTKTFSVPVEKTGIFNSVFLGYVF